MVETIGVALLFLVLLGFEWRYNLRIVRVGSAMLALLVWFVCQPDYTTAVRRVSSAPPEARVTQLHGSTISEYESGVATMFEAIDDVVKERATCRVLALGALIWLGCSPALGRARASKALSSTGG